MVGTVGLYVGVVDVEPEDDGSAEGFVVPVGGAVAAVEFGGAGVEEDAVGGDTEGGVGGAASAVVVEGDGFFEGDGVEGEVKGELLFADAVGVAAVGEASDFMLGDGVGLHLYFFIGAFEFGLGWVGWGFGGGDGLPFAGLGGGVLAHAWGAVGSWLGLQEDAEGEQGEDACGAAGELGCFNQ